MNIQPHKLPFEHIVVDDLFTKDELELMWKELDFLDGKLLPPRETGSAYIVKENGDKQLLKQNKAIYLDKVFSCEHREMSNILKINRKVFHKEIVDAAMKLHPFYELISVTNFDNTLINYYEDNDYYEPHKDVAIFTSVTFLHREPKQYTGGDFVFADYDHVVESKLNRMILFPSIITHSVTPIKMLTDEPGYGRYSMTVFVLQDKNILENPHGF